jgi:hypothetical protein
MEPVTTRLLPRLHHPVVESQEVKAFCPAPDVHDPGLVGMQSEPERPKGGFSQVTGLLGSFLGDAEDDIIIGKTDQLSQSPSRPDPCVIMDVEGDVGEQG